MKTEVRVSLVMALGAMLLMLAAPRLVPEAQEAGAEPLRISRDGYTLSAGDDWPDGAEVFYSVEELFAGDLLYVGVDTPLPEGLPAQQARNVRAMVGLYVPAAEGVALSEETIYALCDLVAENPLVKTWVMAGMRAPTEQYDLQKSAFAAYQATMPLEEALARARRDVPDSGKSEHQLATAFDVRLDGEADWSRRDPMARTEDGRWLLENAWRFGFIRRYPPEKVEITGVENEAAHWRFVGRAHAAAMRVSGWCLEEYLMALHEYGALRLDTPEGETVFLLCRALGAEGASFPLPAGYAAVCSADNLGWAVCALMPEGD